MEEEMFEEGLSEDQYVKSAVVVGQSFDREVAQLENDSVGDGE